MGILVKESTQSSSHFKQRTMKTLLVCVALVASVFGDEAAEAPKAVLPALYGHPFAYPHVYGAPLTYTVPAPIQYKYVPKEVEIETTGCMNSFGNPVPCRARRDADEEAEAPKAVEVPYYYAPSVYGAHLAHPLAYHHLAAPAPVTYTIPEPIVKEIEYETPVYKQVVEKVPLKPLCQNHLGFAVPCA